MEASYGQKCVPPAALVDYETTPIALLEILLRYRGDLRLSSVAEPRGPRKPWIRADLGPWPLPDRLLDGRCSWLTAPFSCKHFDLAWLSRSAGPQVRPWPQLHISSALLSGCEHSPSLSPQAPISTRLTLRLSGQASKRYWCSTKDRCAARRVALTCPLAKSVPRRTHHNEPASAQAFGWLLSLRRLLLYSLTFPSFGRS